MGEGVMVQAQLQQGQALPSVFSSRLLEVNFTPNARLNNASLEQGIRLNEILRNWLLSTVLLFDVSPPGLDIMYWLAA